MTLWRMDKSPSTQSPSTHWTDLSAAARGDRPSRERFVQKYQGLVRSYLTARWGGSTRRDWVEDAVQEVFLECLKPAGVLESAQGRALEGFRRYLYGAVRHVALRFERRNGRDHAIVGRDFSEEAADEARLSRLFDREWAVGLMREAAFRMAEKAAGAEDERAQRRVELLRLRFARDLPIREIARLWNVEAEAVHREYARARRDFRAALMEVAAEYQPGEPKEVEAVCQEMLSLLA